MKVLFIGGTGNLSSACSELAITKGIDLYHLNRGKSAGTYGIKGAKTIIADIRNFKEAQKALEGFHFDAVVDFIAYEPEHILTDIKLFTAKADQFIFISSASVYQTPPEKLPVTEHTPVENPFWEYSRKKIACEDILRDEYKEKGFPYTIIRPSHTYGKTLFPLIGGYTVLNRMIQGLPVVVHGDGTSVWTLTHHKDFAVGLVGLLGNKDAINEAFHITSDEWLTWNGIYNIFAGELGITPHIVHIPSDIIAKYDTVIGDGLLGDKAHSMIFDNTKIKKFVPAFNPVIPFREGVKEIVKWYKENVLLLKPDEHINNLMDRMISDLNDSRLENHS
ncbi:MAG: NAD-dependent epimerase/dehydratase family protein [Paludibacter sp.]|jgi:nucleoside-diphosphate-sugar epimerase|nr:NAD-dependent epimerase/dehydratase family protein [Paludibacter sp.]